MGCSPHQCAATEQPTGQGQSQQHRCAWFAGQCSVSISVCHDLQLMVQTTCTVWLLRASHACAMVQSLTRHSLACIFVGLVNGMAAAGIPPDLYTAVLRAVLVEWAALPGASLPSRLQAADTLCMIFGMHRDLHEQVCTSLNMSRCACQFLAMSCYEQMCMSVPCYAKGLCCTVSEERCVHAQLWGACKEAETGPVLYTKFSHLALAHPSFGASEP